MKITAVHQGSIAEQAGLLAGDDVLSINGFKAFDLLDYKFYVEEEFISLEVYRTNELLLFEIEKDQGETLGVELEELKLSKCGNDCVFCFVDQNPEGLRHTIYFRDGDYRFSFLYGNFVTLTNVGPKALERIVRLRMSPIYISVHSTDAAVRLKLMGMKKDDSLLAKMQYLHDGGIDMHTQIVLCPGMNDGASLLKTVDDLWALHRHVKSLSIVPVGITEHRLGLFHLDKVTPDYANDIIDRVEAWQKKRFKPVVGLNWMYPSDEFYITARRKLPGAKFYDGFGQAENGVGLSRKFIEECKRAVRRFPEELETPKKITFATSVLASGFISDEIHPRLTRIKGLDVQIVTIENKLFGNVVTVAGLLSGRCFNEGLRGKDLGALVVLPPDTTNSDGVFLDDKDPVWLSDELQTPVHIFTGKWRTLIHEIQNTGSQNRLDHNGRKTYLDYSYSAIGTHN